ncbi:hypothetical protein T01_3925 [Trichinella spiralis]|uniref:Uncharacterized protein n=1 Tax=Trichinella spiralis TaxID=6334 RepID=A0A0V1B3E2_TRISP|nr:hypothetical protein T01_3925 [Trichinella spiralis]
MTLLWIVSKHTAQCVWYCNVCIQIEQQRLLHDRFLTLSDFHHSRNRFNKRRTKLHCSEISRKLFPEYNDRISTERTCSNVYILINFSIDIDLSI